MEGIEEQFGDVQERVANEPPSDIERVAERADFERQIAQLRTELKNTQAELDQAKKLNGILEEEVVRTKDRAETAEEGEKRDDLTGLKNKKGFKKSVKKFMEWYPQEAPSGPDQRASTGISLNVAVIDLDGFKSVNDTFGHLAGDEVIKHVAKILEVTLRGNDRVGRWGGDEFVVAFLSPNAGEGALAFNATTVTRKILDALHSHPFVWKDTPIPLRASIGAAKLRAGETYDELFDRADLAAKTAKEKGKDRAVLAEVEEAEAAQKQKAL